MIAVVLALLVAGAPMLTPPAPPAIAVVPAEDRATMLPEAPTIQAVAADVDGDRSRDVVRLVGAGREAVDLEVWRFSGGGWVRQGGALNVVPVRPTGAQGNVVYSGAPVRLVVRSVAGGDRVTLVRQPRFEEPGLEVECCLLLDDVEVVDGDPRLVRVADRGLVADAVLAIDMDGDRTDELLVTTSLPPLGETSFPTAVRVYRWSGHAFAPPVRTDIGVGSGFAPFVLGDSDGVPGDEAGIIGAQARLHRLLLGPGDVAVAESAATSITGATAVPLGEGRGVAVMSTIEGLSVRAWPRGAPIGAALPAETAVADGELLGVVDLRDEPYLAVRRFRSEALQLLALPWLGSFGAPTVTRSPAAAILSGGPGVPFVGRMPGGGPRGETAIVFAGHLIPSEDRLDAPFGTLGTGMLAALPAIEPIGLVGPDRGWIALLHGPFPTGLDPRGGRLDGPVFQPGSGVSVAPLDETSVQEVDDADLEPEVAGAVAVGRQLVTGPEGFSVLIRAPAGSRVYGTARDPSAPSEIDVVPASGRLRVFVRPPRTAVPRPSFRAILVVSTPAGHGYRAAWAVRVLTEPPRIEAAATTSLGSDRVVVTGVTDPGVAVAVNGAAVVVDELGAFRAEVALPPWPTDVEIVATDVVGHAARTTVSGVGWLDYRGLPWAAIAVLLVAVAGVVLFLRVPRPPAAAPRAADDDAELEEMEPD